MAEKIHHTTKTCTMHFISTVYP